MNKLTRTVKQGEEVMSWLANLALCGLAIYGAIQLIINPPFTESWLMFLGLTTCAVVFANCMARVIMEPLKWLLIRTIRKRNETEKSN